MELFSGQESVEETIVVGFALEQGLQEFYLEMQARVTGQKPADLFGVLARVETLHQQRLVALYEEVTGNSLSLEEMAAKVVRPAMEGGLSTEDYLKLHAPDLESVLDILSLAMSIEAQALDLYQRAADRATDRRTAEALTQMANEEREHLVHLGRYIDSPDQR